MKKSLFVLCFTFLGLFGFSQENTSKTALLLIDIQEFYFPEGAVPLVNPEPAAENAARILSSFREKSQLVVHIKHAFGQGGEIHPLVAPSDGEKIITKNEVNAFLGTDLLAYLRENGITNLVLCGMQTHMCLEAATRAAHDFGFDCTVIGDACATRDLKFGDTIVPASMVHAATLSTLNRTYAKVLSTDVFLYE
ncbi:MAG: cysteine hydrolase family protein [Bacteroidales bacterium]|nr:cysteine hydrolase family protein [Bacteroidales bacterium]